MLQLHYILLCIRHWGSPCHASPQVSLPTYHRTWYSRKHLACTPFWHFSQQVLVCEWQSAHWVLLSWCMIQCPIMSNLLSVSSRWLRLPWDVVLALLSRYMQVTYLRNAKRSTCESWQQILCSCHALLRAASRMYPIKLEYHFMPLIFTLYLAMFWFMRPTPPDFSWYNLSRDGWQTWPCTLADGWSVPQVLCQWHWSRC